MTHNLYIHPIPKDDTEPDKEKRTVIVPIRLTPREYNRLLSIAAELDMDVSKTIRHLITDK